MLLICSTLDGPASRTADQRSGPLGRGRLAAAFSRARRGTHCSLVTHRFTTAMLADQIHVMEEGRVLELGSHKELIAQGGRYAAWCSSQNLQ
jgi:ABC-type multidrug transport system fused ATPase/permease subunit